MNTTGDGSFFSSPERRGNRDDGSGPELANKSKS